MNRRDFGPSLPAVHTITGAVDLDAEQVQRCGPCSGNCNQGRQCPARIAPTLTPAERQRLDDDWSAIDAGLALVLLLALAAACLSLVGRMLSGWFA